jgi:hypothetical protein
MPLICYESLIRKLIVGEKCRYGGRGKGVEPRPVQGPHENEHEGAEGPNRSKLKELKRSKRKKEGKDKEKKKGKKKRNHGAGYESWAAVQLDSKQGNEMSNPLQQDVSMRHYGLLLQQSFAH